MNLPLNSVRGRIRHHIERHATRLGDDVLEIGSRLTNSETWWINNRDLAKGQWTGIDMQPGPGVDQVVDIHTPPAEWTGRFSGVLCSEVLEHVARPWIALPNDYYRYTPSGLKLLLEDAGFKNVTTENAGYIEIQLNDHGEPGFCTRQLPLHVFGIAQC